MSFLIDLFVIAIIGLGVFTSSRDGFIRALIELIGFILAIILATSVSTPLAETTYSKSIEAPIIEAIADIPIDEDVDKAVIEVWDQLPKFVTNYAAELGVTKDIFSGKISENISLGAENAIRAALSDIIKPLIVKVLGLIYSIVILSVMSIIIGILAKLINGLFSFGFVKKLNRLLGAVIGLPKGIIYAMIFCVIISFAVVLSGGFWIFTPENIEKTWLFDLLGGLVSINDIAPVNEVLPV